MKETHYIKENGPQIQIRRKSDHGLAFSFSNGVAGKIASAETLAKLHKSYDAIFWSAKFRLEKIGKGKLIRPEHYPE